MSNRQTVEATSQKENRTNRHYQGISVKNVNKVDYFGLTRLQMKLTMTVLVSVLPPGIQH